MGGDGGGHGGRKKQGDLNSFTLSRVQGPRPNFGASANQISKQSPLLRKNLSNQGNMISITYFQVNLLTKTIQCRHQVESNECGTEELFSDSKKRH